MRVLAGYLIDGRSSGIDKYLLRVLEVTKDQGIRFDFLTNKAVPELKTLLEQYEAGLTEIPSLKHPLRQYRFIKKLVGDGSYDMAYFNISEAFNCIGILAARDGGIRRIAVHSHNSRAGGSFAAVRAFRTGLHICFKPVAAAAAASFYACSSNAGEWMFPKRIMQSGRCQVIHNAVDTGRFAFDPEVRRRMRQELGLEGRTVIGHVGSYCYAKNNFFLLDIMEALLAKVPEALMLAVGEGPDWESVKAAAVQRGLSGHIRFLGIRDDVPALLQAMDFFVLPSRFEGQPIAAIEAQAAGLKTIISSTVTREAVLSDYCMQAGIEDAGEWARLIARQGTYKRMDIRENPRLMSAYDMETQKEQILKIFLEEERCGEV